MKPEKIRELAKQADIIWDHHEDVIYTTMTFEQLEKFSELLIQEFVKVAELADSTWHKDDPARRYVSARFGVK